jgi:aminopeptidase
MSPIEDRRDTTATEGGPYNGFSQAASVLPSPRLARTLTRMRDPRLDKLANVLVTYSVNVRRGDLVRISGSVVALPLIRAVYREVLSAGGNPLLRISDDECTDIFYEMADAKQLKYLSPLAIQEIETVDCTIGMWADTNTKALTRVDPQRQAAASQARRPVMDIFMKRAALKGRRKLRWTGTQYPTNASAQDA